jgi:hypothetical protein
MKRFYEMTQQELGEHLRSLYVAQPKADWNALAVGNFILNKGRAWCITRIPPKRGFILATNVLSGNAEKLLRSCYDNDDLQLTDEPTLALLRTTHQAEIEKAIAAGIGISLIVQYDYPEIFTPFPESSDQKRRDKAHDLWLRINEMRAFYDHTDPPGWQFGKVADLIAQAKEGISSWESYRADVRAGVGIKKPEAIPRIVASVDETIRELQERIEILGHLRKHLENTVCTVRTVCTV